MPKLRGIFNREEIQVIGSLFRRSITKRTDVLERNAAGNLQDLTRLGSLVLGWVPI